MSVANEILHVSEVFYSLQGEGGRAGEPSIFIRLQGCKAKHACYQSGIRCDTEFESGSPYTLQALLEKAREIGGGCRWIVWTGGEPLDQLTGEILEHVKGEGFQNALETSGLHPCPAGVDYLTVSPKVAEHVIEKNFEGKNIDEMRYVRHKGQSIPQPRASFSQGFISPHFDGYTINQENLEHCIRLCLDNPDWRLSVQLHKLWQIL